MKMLGRRLGRTNIGKPLHLPLRPERANKRSCPIQLTHNQTSRQAMILF